MLLRAAAKRLLQLCPTAVSVRLVSLSGLGLLGLACCTPTPDPNGPVLTTSSAGAALSSLSASASTTNPSVASASASASATPAPFDELDVDPKSFDFDAHPDLVERISESPHAYFRFTQRLFARVICKKFADRLASAPRVRLHGDPHVEQYAVSDLGRSLVDYDDASVGPAIIDLSRFATSAILAIRQLGGDKDQEAKALNELFRGYKEGLEGKPLPKQPPAFVTTLTSKFGKERKPFLDFVSNSLVALEKEEDGFVRGQVKAYIDVVKGKEPKRPAGFYDVKKVGKTTLGIGSALTRKFLLVIEGQSKAEGDDVVMEVKQIADLSSVPCVQGIPAGAADARADEQRRAGEKGLLVPVLLPDNRFWVNEWLSNYQEVKIKKLTQADIEALVYEAGVMLGYEHLKQLPDGGKQDKKKLLLDASTEQEIKAIGADLAAKTVSGWERFKREVKP